MTTRARPTAAIEVPRRRFWFTAGAGRSIRRRGSDLPSRTDQGVKMREARSTVEASAKLVELVYELLDAHDDTARLAQELGRDVQWAAHLDYLQQLQRVGRELLAVDVVAP